MTFGLVAFNMQCAEYSKYDAQIFVIRTLPKNAPLSQPDRFSGAPVHFAFEQLHLLLEGVAIEVYRMRHHRVIHHLDCQALAPGAIISGVTFGQYSSFIDHA
jgi:hypothetical protein